MHLIVLGADATRIRLEVACHRLGEDEARSAFSLALNNEGDRQRPRVIYLPGPRTKLPGRGHKGYPFDWIWGSLETLVDKLHCRRTEDC